MENVADSEHEAVLIAEQSVSIDDLESFKKQIGNDSTWGVEIKHAEVLHV